MCSDNTPINNNQTTYIIAGAVSSTIFLAAIIVISFLTWQRQKKRHEGYAPLVDVSSWTMIEDIEIHEWLGGGNFGNVYHGTWNGTTTVALKKLKNKSMLEAFTREATMLQTVNHPNVVRFLGIYTDTDREQYIVTKYLSKGSLDVVVMKQKNKLTVVDLLVMYVSLYVLLLF